MDVTGSMVIDRTEIEFGEKIGKGAFGKVYKVKLKIKFNQCQVNRN